MGDIKNQTLSFLFEFGLTLHNTEQPLQDIELQKRRRQR